MDWHHGNLRKGSAMLVWHHVLAPLIKQKGNAALAEYSEVVLLQSLEVRRVMSTSASQEGCMELS